MELLKRAWDGTPSVAAKFVLLLIPTVVLTAALFCGIYYYQKYSTLHRSLVEKLGVMAEAHAMMLSASMWTMDEASTRVIVRALSAIEGVVCVEASDELIMRSYAWPVYGCADIPATATVRRDIVNSGRRIGRLAAHYADAALRDAIKTDIAGTVSLVFLVLCGTVVTAVAAHRVIIGRPLRHFVDSITQAERRQARTAVAWESADEMGRVIAAYNRLVVRLGEDEAALANERNLLQVTLDNIDQGVLMVDGGLTISLFNRRAAQYLGVTEDFLRQRPRFADVVRRQEVHGDFADSVEDYDLWPEGVRQLLTRPVAFKRRRPDGIVLEVRSNPLADGGFVRTLTDITAEARASEEMVRAMQELEVAYRELKETQANLIQAEKMASLAMLVAGVAHEINTPVGIAFGCATHLSAKTRELSEALTSAAMKRSMLTGYVAQANESARLIQQNLGRAAELIQSFKQVAVDQTSQERRAFDLATYLGEVITSLQPRLRHSRHRIVLDCPPRIAMDSYPGALSQVVTNLVINALVHAFDEHKEGVITISARMEDDGENVNLTCADNGRGISAENLPRIFEPFFTTRRGNGGSGLGLHIVFNLVSQTLAGRIAAESVINQGACFYMRLPRITPILDPAARATSVADPANPITQGVRFA